MFAVWEPLRSSRHLAQTHGRRLSQAIRARDPGVLCRDRNPRTGNGNPSLAAVVVHQLPTPSTIVQRGHASEFSHGASTVDDLEYRFSSLRTPRIRGSESIDGAHVLAGLCILMVASLSVAISLAGKSCELMEELSWLRYTAYQLPTYSNTIKMSNFAFHLWFARNSARANSRLETRPFLAAPSLAFFFLFSFSIPSPTCSLGALEGCVCFRLAKDGGGILKRERLGIGGSPSPCCGRLCHPTFHFLHSIRLPRLLLGHLRYLSKPPLLYLAVFIFRFFWGLHKFSKPASLSFTFALLLGPFHAVFWFSGYSVRDVLSAQALGHCYMGRYEV